MSATHATGGAGVTGITVSEPPKSVVARALSVLAVFGTQTPVLSLGDVAAACGLPAPTTYRMLRELTAGGYVEKREDGSYQLGVRLWEMGMMTPVHRLLRETALPYLLQLQRECLQTVQLAVLAGDEALYVEKLTIDPDQKPRSRIGDRVALHATGIGKALVARGPAALRARILDAPLPSYGPGTITDPSALCSELSSIAERGYALSDREYGETSTSIAAVVPGEWPLRTAVGLVNYHRDRHLDRFAEPLLRCVAAIGEALAQQSAD